MKLIVGILLMLVMGAAGAVGPKIQVKNNATVRWDAVTTRLNGRPVSGAVVYHVYAGTSESNLRLVAESVVGTSWTGLVVAEGQNYVGVIAEEAGNMAGPSPISELFPFEGEVLSPPRSPVVSGVE